MYRPKLFKVNYRDIILFYCRWLYFLCYNNIWRLRLTHPPLVVWLVFDPVSLSYQAPKMTALELKHCNLIELCQLLAFCVEIHKVVYKLPFAFVRPGFISINTDGKHHTNTVVVKHMSRGADTLPQATVAGSESNNKQQPLVRVPQWACL